MGWCLFIPPIHPTYSGLGGMVIFHKKLLELIGETPINEWARTHRMPPQTVHGWISDKRIPGSGNLKLLIQATGKPKEWWFGDDSQPAAFKAEQTQAIYSNVKKYADTLYIEHYTEVRGAAGDGQVNQVNQDDQVVVNLAISAAEWRNKVGLNSEYVKVITVFGDSMMPTLQHGDQVLIDTSIAKFIDDSIYAIQQDEMLRIKRIKLRLDGSIEVKSDNNQGFTPEIYTKQQTQALHVVGRVVPFKFGKFDL